MAKLRFITDSQLRAYSSGEVTNPGDFNMKYDYPRDITKGIFDHNIFGSIYPDKCNCGRTKGGIPCRICGSNPISLHERLTRVGHIELPCYYVSPVAFPLLMKLLKNSKSVQGADKIKSTKQLYISQWTITDSVISYTNDGEYQGISGLLLALGNLNKPVDSILEYVHSVLLVPGIEYRRVSWWMSNGKKSLVVDPINNFYMSLLSMIKDSKGSLLELGYIAYLAEMISDKLSKVLKESKKNYARKMQNTRVRNSGRGTIVSNVDIDIEHVSLPQSMIYDIFAQQYSVYLERLGYDHNTALLMIKCCDSDAMRHFSSWVEDKTVLIGRQPTLHKGSVLALKVSIDLSDDQVIGLNPAMLKSLNADFDGDQVWVYAVPDEYTASVQGLSPRYHKKYIKNGKYLVGFSQAQMSAFLVYGRINRKSTIDRINLDKDEEYIFSKDESIVTEGGLTTLRRLYLNQLLGIDLDVISNYQDYTADTLNTVLGMLSESDDVSRIHLLQTLLGKFITLQGYSTIELDRLTKNVDAFSRELLDLSKSASNSMFDVVRAYDKMIENYTSQLKSDERIRVSDRAKSSALMTLALPSVIFDKDGNSVITTTSYLGGLSFRDMVTQGMNNRNVQYVKKVSVPESGYVFRQLTNLAANYSAVNDEDEYTGEGVLVSGQDAVDRTTLDGRRITVPTDNVYVRSILDIKSKSIPLTCTTYSKSNVGYGYDVASAFQEEITQSQLALKHGGSAFAPDAANLITKVPAKVVSVEHSVLTAITDKGDEIKYYVSKSIHYMDKLEPDSFNSYDAMVTPSYSLRNIIATIGSIGVSSEVSELNIKPLIGDVVALVDGTIEVTSKGVVIGGILHKFTSTCIYPDGYKVKRGTLLTTGALNIKSAINKIGWRDSFYVFRDYIRKHNNLNSHMLEFMYNLLTPDEKYIKVNKQLNSRESVMDKVIYQNAKSTLRSAAAKGEEVRVDSLLTTLYLSHGINTNRES